MRIFRLFHFEGKHLYKLNSHQQATNRKEQEQEQERERERERERQRQRCRLVIVKCGPRLGTDM
jgi:hypothetical protein